MFCVCSFAALIPWVFSMVFAFLLFHYIKCITYVCVANSHVEFSKLTEDSLARGLDTLLRG